MYRLLKKISFLILSIFIITLNIYAGNLDSYVYTFDSDQLLVSSQKNLNVLGLYLKYYETGNEEYKTAANQTRPYILSSLKPDDSAALNVLSEYYPGNEEQSINRIEILTNNYPDSVIVNALNVLFNFEVWQKTKNMETFNEILSSIDIIEKAIGENPFSVYYKSLLTWEAASLQEKKNIFKNLEKVYFSYPSNRKIQELLIVQAFELGKFEDVKQLSTNYVNLSQKDERIMFLIALSYYNLNEKLESRKIVDWILQNSNKKAVLSKSYELLGDISETNSQKINYYKTAIDLDPENAEALTKLGTTLYESDKTNTDNLTISRIYLTKALMYDPDNSEIKQTLNTIDRKLTTRNFLTTLLPLFIVISAIFYIVFKFGKEKEIDNDQSRRQPHDK
ncbi:tetratricopeptide repeat protein [Petrotoga sp. DB-2]